MDTTTLTILGLAIAVGAFGLGRTLRLSAEWTSSPLVAAEGAEALAAKADSLERRVNWQWAALLAMVMLLVVVGTQRWSPEQCRDFCGRPVRTLSVFQCTCGEEDGMVTPHVWELKTRESRGAPVAAE